MGGGQEEKAKNALSASCSLELIFFLSQEPLTRWEISQRPPHVCPLESFGITFFSPLTSYLYERMTQESCIRKILDITLLKIFPPRQHRVLYQHIHTDTHVVCFTLSGHTTVKI